MIWEMCSVKQDFLRFLISAEPRTIISYLTLFERLILISLRSNDFFSSVASRRILSFYPLFHSL